MAKQKNTPERVDVTTKEVASRSSICEVLQAYIGQPVSVIAARFNYRGIVSSVGSDHIILAQARAVEESGPSSGATPVTEDIIGSSVVISIAAVEIIMQPNWVFAPLE
jgi:hypothetical protein